MAEQVVGAGERAPAFKLDSSTGQTISLADYAGKRDGRALFLPKG